MIQEYTDEIMRSFVQETLSDKETLMNFGDKMAGKSWEVLIAPDNYIFITNDNPGYSFFVENGVIDRRTFNYNFTINVKSVNIYPITPKYCLQIAPISYNPDDSVNSYPKLYYKYIKENNVNEINQKTKLFMKRYLISNSKAELECVKSRMNQ